MKVVLHTRIQLFLIWKFITSTVFYSKVSEVGDLSQVQPKGSYFNSYYTEVYGRALLHSLDCFTLPLILTL